MSNVFEICNPNKIWTLEEANGILPLLNRISNDCDKDVDELLRKQRGLINIKASDESIKEIDKQVVDRLNKWGRKLWRLGIKVYSGFMLFNNGTGYYSWLKNEKSIKYHILYSDDPYLRRVIE